jgi:phage shock protein A
MFAAIGRIFRSIGYWFTGKLDGANSSLLGNTSVVEATYSQVIVEKKKRINEYTAAIATMVANKEKKKIRLDELTEEIDKLKRLQSGALAKAKERVSVIGQENTETLQKDPDYVKCQGAYRDFSSTLVEKTKAMDGLVKDLGDIGKSLTTHKASIEALMRDLEKIKDEKGNAVAQIISATEEKKIGQMLAGLSEDKTAKDLENIRNKVNNVTAEAQVAREISGIDAKRSEDEFLAYAESSVADDEFAKLLGVTKENKVVTPVVDTSKITE